MNFFEDFFGVLICGISTQELGTTVGMEKSKMCVKKSLWCGLEKFRLADRAARKNLSEEKTERNFSAPFFLLETGVSVFVSDSPSKIDFPTSTACFHTAVIAYNSPSLVLVADVHCAVS